MTGLGGGEISTGGNFDRTTEFEDAITRYHKFTTVSVDQAIDVRGNKTYNHRLTWTGSGTRTTGNIKLEQSVDGLTWTDLIAAQSATTDGTATTTGWCNWVRLNCTVISGASNAIYATYEGSPIAVAISSVAITDSSSNALTSTASALDVNIKSGLGSDAAVDATTNTNPLPITGAAATTERTAVSAAGDANYGTYTMAGLPVIQPSALPGDFWEYSVVATDNAEKTIKAGEANYYMVVTHLFVQNSHATNATLVTFKAESLAGVFSTQTAGNGVFAICGTNTTSTQINVRGYRTKIKPVA
jgi:hypothetical protein